MLSCSFCPCCNRYNGLLEGVAATVMEYALEVRLSTGESWKVSHRYSAFSGLYEEILRTKGGRGACCRTYRAAHPCSWLSLQNAR